MWFERKKRGEWETNCLQQVFEQQPVYRKGSSIQEQSTVLPVCDYISIPEKEEENNKEGLGAKQECKGKLFYGIWRWENQISCCKHWWCLELEQKTCLKRYLFIFDIFSQEKIIEFEQRRPLVAAFHKASKTFSMSRVGTHRKYSLLQGNQNSHKLLSLQVSKRKMVHKSTNQAKHLTLHHVSQ